MALLNEILRGQRKGFTIRAKRLFWYAKFFTHADGDMDIDQTWSTEVPKVTYVNQRKLCFFPKALYPHEKDLPKRRREIDLYPEFRNHTQNLRR